MGHKYDDACHAILALMDEEDYPRERPIPRPLWDRLVLEVTGATIDTARKIVRHGEVRGYWERQSAGGKAGVTNVVLLRA